MMSENTRERWNEIYRRRGVVVGMEEDNFIVILGKGPAYILPPAVYYVWTLCDGETPIGAIVQLLLQDTEQDVTLEDVYDAVITIIDKLHEVGLVEKV